MKTTTWLVGLGLAVAMAGAAAGQPVAAPPASSETVAPPASSPEGPRISWVVRSAPPPFFDRTSSGSVLFGGLVGAVVWSSEGAKAVAADHIEDPGNALAAKIARLYAPGVGAVPDATPLDGGGLKGRSPKSYAAIGGGARYVVDVETEGFGTIWASYVTWPIDLSHYIVEYGARVRIEDLQAGKEVYSGACGVFTKRRPGLPTHEEMYANGGAVLKAMIDETVDQCLATLTAKGLSLAPG